MNNFLKNRWSIGLLVGFLSLPAYAGIVNINFEDGSTEQMALAGHADGETLDASSICGGGNAAADVAAVCQKNQDKKDAKEQQEANNGKRNKAQDLQADGKKFAGGIGGLSEGNGANTLNFNKPISPNR